MDDLLEKRPSRRLRALGYLLAGAGLIWLFYDINGRDLLKRLTITHWRWIPLAIILDIATYACQGVRWKMLLQPLGRIRIVRTIQAIYAGLFSNELIPMRFGELVRAYLVSRWMKVKLANVVPSIVVERLLDGVWLAIAVSAVMIFLPLPKDLSRAGEIFGTAVLLGLGLFLYAIFKGGGEPQAVAPGPCRRRSGSYLAYLLARFGADFRAIGLSRFFAYSVCLSWLVRFLQSAAFWLMMLACGLDLPYWKGAVVYLVMVLGTMVPNTPANVGTYQFFTVLGLRLFGVDKTAAIGFSVMTFVILTVPLWLLGLLAVAKSGMSLKDIHRDIRRLTARRQPVILES